METTNIHVCYLHTPQKEKHKLIKVSDDNDTRLEDLVAMPLWISYNIHTWMA